MMCPLGQSIARTKTRRQTTLIFESRQHIKLNPASLTAEESFALAHCRRDHLLILSRRSVDFQYRGNPNITRINISYITTSRCTNDTHILKFSTFFDIDRLCPGQQLKLTNQCCDQTKLYLARTQFRRGCCSSHRGYSNYRVEWLSLHRTFSIWGTVMGIGRVRSPCV